MRERRDCMLAGICRAHDVDHLEFSQGQRVGDERAVAAPRHGLRAHDCRRFLPRPVRQLHERRGEISCLHVIRKTSEGRVLPRGVNGIPFRLSQAAESRHVNISNPSSSQRFGKGFFVVLWIVAGAGDSANVGNLLDAVRIEHFDKGVDGVRRVSHRVYCLGHAAATNQISRHLIVAHREGSDPFPSPDFRCDNFR